MSFSFDIPTTVIWASLCAVCTHVQQRCRSSRTAFLLILATVNTGTYTNDGVYRSLRFLITHSYLALLMQPRKYSYLQDVRYAIGISANICNLNVAQGPSLSPLPHVNTRAPAPLSTPINTITQCCNNFCLLLSTGFIAAASFARRIRILA